jgi:PAS domain-containing protein
VVVRQRNVALILARELAVNVATPMWIWDENGELVYFNEHVQDLLGSPPSDLGRLDELPRFEPRDLNGDPIDVDDLPSAIASRSKRPAHRDLQITALDGSRKLVSATAFPLFARGGEFVGAVSVFWEIEDNPV